jgi:hypothetical protein
MALRKQDVVRLPIRLDAASVLPRPLLELYNRASLFLDKDSTHQDHYWAVGIHKAIHKSFPEWRGAHTATATMNPRLPAAVLPSSPQITLTHRKSEPQVTIKQFAGTENRSGNACSPQLTLSFAGVEQAEASRSGQGHQPKLHRFDRVVSMQKGQRVLLVSAIWSTRNRITIESGTWGEVAEVGSTIKVKWNLPYFRKRLWDRFRPDEYLDYFEEE